MRLFVGIALDDEVTAVLSDALGELWAQGHDLAWTRPAGWHTTLAYLGETTATPQDVADAVATAVAATPRPTLALGVGARWWDRSLVLPVHDDDWCVRVGSAVQSSLVDEGLAVVRREVVPHVTLGRRRGARTAAPPFDAAVVDLQVAERRLVWTPGSVDVFASCTGDGPARYPVLASIALDPAVA